MTNKAWNFKDLTGQKFGKLIALNIYKSENGRKVWKCKCDCGNICYVLGTRLTSKNTKSCGCLKHEIKSNLKHGKTNERLYHVWQGMKSRCYYPKNIKYKNYGGRGIKVCDEWIDKENGFINFYNWAMVNGYDENKSRKEQSLDRINNDKDYSPDNCRFVTQSVNCRNRNNNVLLTYNNETKTIAEWSKLLNINERLISTRAKKYKDTNEILSKENLLKKKHKSNTGEFGISKDKKNKFQLHLNHKYYGQFKTLEEAIKKREDILNEIR